MLALSLLGSSGLGYSLGLIAFRVGGLKVCSFSEFSVESFCTV